MFMFMWQCKMRGMKRLTQTDRMGRKNRGGGVREVRERGGVRERERGGGGGEGGGERER